MLSKHLIDLHRVHEQDLDNFEAEIKSLKEERVLLIQKTQDRPPVLLLTKCKTCKGKHEEGTIQDRDIVVKDRDISSKDRDLLSKLRDLILTKLNELSDKIDSGFVR